MNPADKLAGTPGVQRAPTRELELFVVRGFLDLPTCAKLIEMVDAQRRPSTIADDIGIANFRTSETCDLDWHVPVVGDIDRKIADLLGLTLTASEPLQGQRYEVGQCFKEHSDFFYVDQPYWAEYEPHGGQYDFLVHTADRGQRTWTAMIYLNEPEDGGATRFKKIAKTVQPEAGKLLAWNNLLPDGRPNPATLHQGMKVRRGTKYVLTKWFRQHPSEG